MTNKPKIGTKGIIESRPGSAIFVWDGRGWLASNGPEAGYYVNPIFAVKPIKEGHHRLCEWDDCQGGCRDLFSEESP